MTARLVVGSVLAWTMGAGLAVAAVQPADEHSAAMSALMGQVVGDDPAASWSWLPAHAAMRPKATEERELLRRGLFDLYLRQAGGEDWPRNATIADVIARAGEGRDPEFDFAAHARWAQALKRQLRPVWPSGPEPLPAALAGSGERVTQVAPGLWTGSAPDGSPAQAVWTLTVAHVGTTPLAVGQLELMLRVPDAKEVTFVCPAAGEATIVVAPRQNLALVCRSRERIGDERSGWPAMVRRVAAREMTELDWLPGDLRRQGGPRSMIDALIAAAPPGRLADFERRHAPCESRGRCAEEPPAASNAPTARVAKPRGMSPLRRSALATAAVIGLFMAFCALARWRNDRVAAIAMALCGLPLAYALGRGEGAASALLVPMYAGLALIASLAFLIGYRVYDWLIFRRFG